MVEFFSTILVSVKEERPISSQPNMPNPQDTNARPGGGYGMTDGGVTDYLEDNMRNLLPIGTAHGKNAATTPGGPGVAMTPSQ